MPLPAALAGLVAPLLLGGLLRMEQSDLDRWPDAGAWRMPVGRAHEAPTPSAVQPRFRLLRGLQGSAKRRTHEGADLGNGREGDSVVAAATGLVVHTGRDGGSGFGDHVVLAHRLPRGALRYSVYAHLVRGTTCVRAGEVVSAGQLLGRVGSTGRASGPHLHFEIRRPADPGERWENAPVEDPLAFVLDRLPDARRDSTWARPYLEWAEHGGLLPSGARADDELSRADWWRMLAAAARVAPAGAPERCADLRDSLVAWSLLPEESLADAAHMPAEWAELSRDLDRLRRAGTRLAPRPTGDPDHRRRCESILGESHPARELRELERRDGVPTLGVTCLLLADLGPSARRPSKLAAKSAKKPPKLRSTKRSSKSNGSRRTSATARPAGG